MFILYMLLDLFWMGAAKLLAIPAVATFIIRRAMRTPYFHIWKPARNASGGHDIYMCRYWLFNPYQKENGDVERSKYKWWPWNIRVHHIRRADVDEHHHDHPWNARTIILRGWYNETRLHREVEMLDSYETQHVRKAGDTALIEFGQYHSITQVPPEGVWTLFISGPYQGTWGFWVDNVKMTWREYLGINK